MRSVRQSLASSIGGARQIALVLLELGLEALEQGEGVGRAAGETRRAPCRRSRRRTLRRVALHDDVAERHLAVAAERDLPPRRTETIVVP